MRRASQTLRTEGIGSPSGQRRSRSEERHKPPHEDAPCIPPLDTIRTRATSEDSERIQQIQDTSHKRSVSDPFDASQIFAPTEEEPPAEGSAAQNGVAGGGGGEAYQTLPRFPVASTRDLNCWSEPPVDIFHVRGPHYLKDRKKQQSGPYLLRTRGCDLLLSEHAPENVGRFGVLGGSVRSVPSFIINFRFPWGMLIQHFEIPKKFTPFLRSDDDSSELPPIPTDWPAPERTLAKFFLADQDTKNDTLKLIPYIADGPWIVKNMVTGRPAIIGNKLPVTYTYQPPEPHAGLACYLEADLDIGNSSATAKRIVSVCRRYMNALTLDVGFVLEGKTEEELPEQMLCSIRVHGVDPLKAPTFSE